MKSPKPNIGDTVWYFDPNHRVYKKDANGKGTGGPIWRDHWRPAKGTGETRLSWIVGHDYYEVFRIKKKQWSAMIALGAISTSEEHITQLQFVEDRFKIASAVGKCLDYATLKAIHDLLHPPKADSPDPKKDNQT